ncbi:MAG: DUF2304 family protein [Candidatus Magasanikbacteria bacterium]|jgi:small membrane protein|nr:DUF2304 family protein [Candidatus Magasanikbacteria bacterium]
MNLFQILFSLITVSALYLLVKKRSTAVISSKALVTWMLIWIAAEGIVLFPESSSYVASVLGIGRGADVVLYIAIVLLFLLMFRLYIKMEKVSREVTQIVRKQAVKDAHKPKE